MQTASLILILVSFLLSACTGHAPVNKPTTTHVPKQENGTQSMTPTRPSVPDMSALPTQCANGVSIAGRADVQAFIADMSRKYGFSQSELRKVFNQVYFQDAILTAISKPYEAKPWHVYKKLFLTDTRVQGGIEFRVRHSEALANAEKKYGVSPEIITAIIGIESSYGNRPGNYKAIEALSTLGFGYPKRGGFFRGELEQFLLLCREEGMDPLQPLSSYAGAMGLPQFMPSSYRRLAADGDGDGRRDIWNNPADAIASVARYFAANGWQTGEPIAVAARIEDAGVSGLVSKNFKPDHSLAEFEAYGVVAESPIGGAPKAALVKLEEENRNAYWLGFQNLFVITRYNHSPLYAVAAYELSRRIAP